METEAGSGIERRTAPRAAVRAELSIEYPDLNRLADAICRDISVGGMFVECQTPLPVGTEIRFDLHLPPPKRGVVRGEGLVVWCRPFEEGQSRPGGFGVRFVQLDPRFRRLIYRIVDRFIQRGGDPFDLEHEAEPPG